nr:MAG TPA: hypothetical protein [Caudoviricetes sp.]
MARIISPLFYKKKRIFKFSILKNSPNYIRS